MLNHDSSSVPSRRPERLLKNPYNTKPMKIKDKNIAIAAKILGKDCGKLQYLRELTQNSIEAIQKRNEVNGTPDAPGKIVWDVDWDMADAQSEDKFGWKLCITDDGIGMTGQEIDEYCNELSSSGREQSEFGNFGMGAKIAAMTRHPVGMLYVSYKNSIGVMSHIWFDPIFNAFGLKDQEQPNGVYAYPVNDAAKPHIITTNGTRVTLMGREDLDATCEPPKGARTPSKWISRYLNTRYYQFPKNIDVRTRESWKLWRATNDKRFALRKVYGQKYYLDSFGKAKGSLELTESTVRAKAHWWILDQAPTQAGWNAAYFNHRGHTAALYENELYDVRTNQEGGLRLQKFGVRIGTELVVIYVEPLDKRSVKSNTSRSMLLVSDSTDADDPTQALPWEEWAKEFRDHLPQEIVKYLMAIIPPERDFRDNLIKQRINSIKHLIDNTRYRSRINGRHEARVVDEEDEHADADDALEVVTEIKRRKGTRGDNGNGNPVITNPDPPARDPVAESRAYEVYAAKPIKPRKTRATRDGGGDIKWPLVSWVTAQEQDLADRAARYSKENRHLLINRDFRVFTDLIEHHRRRLKAEGPILEVIKTAVETWFEQALTECIIGAEKMDGPHWDIVAQQGLVSDEALTAVVLGPRYHVDKAVNRDVMRVIKEGIK